MNETSISNVVIGNGVEYVHSILFEKEKRIKEAEGHAQAIEKEGIAKANAIKYIKEAAADEAVLAMQSMEAMKEVAQGQSNTLIIPSDLSSVAGLAATLKTVTDNTKEKRG